MKQLTDALERGKALGADYIDARLVHAEEETIYLKGGQVQSLGHHRGSGVAIRLLVDGVWGYAATNVIADEAVLAAVDEANDLARTVPGFRRRVSIGSQAALTGEYQTPVDKDPFSIPVGDKVTLLGEASRRLLEVPGVRSSNANCRFHRDQITFVSSEGANIQQVITWGGAGMQATAEGKGLIQKRSYPFRGEGGNGWNFQTGGWEIVEDMNLLENVERVGTQAVQLLSAPLCPSGVMTVILDHTVLGKQIHESVGHPIEMDRVLGDELANFGGSFIPLDQIGSFRYGSDIVNIDADATTHRGAGSYGFDDEGVPAQCSPIVRDGILVNLLNSRETAPLIGKTSNGTMRAVGTGNFPIIRMNNINLLPGTSSLKEMIADTEDGLFLDTYQSYDIDDMRVNFTYAVEVGWLIKNGQITGMVRNPSYASNSTWFWTHCDAIAGPDEWRVIGVPACGKGQPWQFTRVGHGSSPARFRQIPVRL